MSNDTTPQVVTMPQGRRRALRPVVAISAVVAAIAVMATVAVGAGLVATSRSSPWLGSPVVDDQAAFVQQTQPQTVPVTIQPNRSQNALIPAPGDNDFTKIPAITANNPNLVLASATYSPDHKNLVVSVMNVNTNGATSGQLTVTDWGSYPVTVQPNPSQLVYVDIPTGYNTSHLPTVTSNSPNLALLSATYGNDNDALKLIVNLGNPFPNTAISGNIAITW